MPNTRSSQIGTPDFDPQASVSGSLPTMPGVSSASAEAVKGVADQVGAMAGGFADSAAQREGQQAGAVAGLDPNWRPAGDPTIRGQAYDQAAQSTYVNSLQTQTRQAISDAYQTYQNLPVDQQDPVAFKKSLDGLQTQFEQDHVFPSILPQFRKQFADQAYTYAQKAQDLNDTQVQDQSKASFLSNQQSSSNSAMRAASLVTPAGDVLAQQEADAHDRLVDEQVNQGIITAVQGQKAKSDFRQALSQTALMAKFNSLPPAQQPAFLDSFQKGYGSGDASAGASYYDRLAHIESGGDATRVNPTTKAAGLYQFLPSTARDYQLADPTDPEDSLAAVKRLTADNRAALSKGLGRDPTEGELYLAHQQGAAGALKLLQNPDAPAIAAVGRAAVVNNQGTAAMTAGQFASMWEAKFGGAGNQTNGLDDNTFDTLRGQMASTILRNQHASNALTTESLHEIEGVQKTLTDGTDVPPDVWSALQGKYATSGDPKVQAALGQASAVRAALAGNKGQTPQQLETSMLAAGVPTSPQAEAVQKAQQSYLIKYRSDLDQDPLGRAAREGVIGGVQPIDFTKPDSVLAGLQARQPQAQQAAGYFGRGVTMLLPDERAQLKAIATKGGAPMVATARAAVQALGPAAGSLFTEVGGEAPAFAAAGRVAAIGGAPGFVNDLAQAQAITQDPAARRGLDEQGAAGEETARTLIGTGLAAAPEMNAQVRQAARQVYALRALNGGLDPKAPSSEVMTRTLNEAAGGTYDGATQYGGFTDYKAPGWYMGSQANKIVAPPAMRADGVRDAIGALNDGDLKAMGQPPVAGDGKTPLPASALQHAYLTTVGHGVYWVSRNDPAGDDPQWAMAPAGGRFRLDLNALEPALRARVPDLYRGR